MSHDEPGHTDTKRKLVYNANQIAAFFHTMPEAERVAGVADHINKFWEPRMRRQFFEMVDNGEAAGLDPLVIDALPQVKRPRAEAA